MSSNGKFAVFTIFCIVVTCQLSSALTVPSSLQNRRLNNINHQNQNDLKNTKLQDDNVLYPFALWRTYMEMAANGDFENMDRFATRQNRLTRSKRFADKPSAIDLALSHTTADDNGRTVDRGVFEPFTVSSSSGGGNSLNDFRLNSYRGVGSVVYRSDNRRHTVGVGATSDSHMGRNNGNSYSRPNYGAGLGYTFRF